MKLDRLAFLVATIALACGCSTSSLPAVHTASAAPLHAETAAEAANIAGTTNLMSAQLAGPAPKVGKAHLAGEDVAQPSDIESGSTNDGRELDAPKEARRSDGSHRSGGFGSSK